MRDRGSLLLLGAPVLGACLAAITHCSWMNDLDALGAGSADSATPVEAQATDDGATGLFDSALLPSPPDADEPADTATAESSTDSAPDAADAKDAGPLEEPPIYADAGADTWCSGQAALTFCADFDRAPLPAGFTSSEGAFLSLTSTRPSSPANDLALIMPAQDGPGAFSSKLARSFTAPASEVTLAFDFLPETINTTASGMLFAALDFLGNPQAKYSIRLAYNQGFTRVEESYLGFPTDIFHPAFNLPTGKWSRLRLAIAFGADGGPSTLGVYVDEVLQGTLEALSPPPALDARPSLLVGAVYGTYPHTGWLLRYDDVTLDLR